MDSRCLSVLLLASFAAGQATPAASPKAPAPAAQTKSAAKTSTSKASGELAPTTPVITIQGVCDKPAASKTATVAAKAKTSSECKTVITKAEFESLASALQPNMNPSTKRMLADRYPKMLAFAAEAHKRGLDASPSFKKVLQFYRDQILTQELARSVKEESEKIPDTEVDKYYKDNPAQFEQASLQRLYVPRQKQVEAAAEKPEAKSADQQKTDEEALKKEADTLRTRAAAGEDFDKLQKEAYEAAGLKGTPPQTNIGELTRDELPVTHRSVMDLKAGEVSQVIAEPNGYYVYKVVSKDEKPLNSVQAEIRNKLAQQQFQDEMQRIEGSAKTELNEAYFGTPPAGPGMPGMPGANPGAGQRPAPAAPQATPPGASQSTPPAPPTVNTTPSTENPQK